MWGTPVGFMPVSETFLMLLLLVAGFACCILARQVPQGQAAARLSVTNP
jgi:hypothetical protein